METLFSLLSEKYFWRSMGLHLCGMVFHSCSKGFGFYVFILVTQKMNRCHGALQILQMLDMKILCKHFTSASVLTRCVSVFSGGNTNYKLGEINLQYSKASSSNICYSSYISCSSLAKFPFYVGSWDDIWLWIRILAHYIDSSNWCIPSILHWLPLLS